jgi:hypothetical protein
MVRRPAPLSPDAVRAAKATQLGATIAEAAKRYGVAKSAISRARKEQPPGSMPTFAETALAALTNLGLDTTGSIDRLEHVAGWLQYTNKDDSTAASVRALLEEHVATGLLELDGATWTLTRPWP